MRSDYKGVKFYGKHDISVQWMINDAEGIINRFDQNKQIEDINEILELYNVQELFESGIKLTKWSNEEYNQYLLKAKSITPVLAKFFSKINDQTMIEFHKKVDFRYYDDFWALFVKFKCYDRVTSEAFDALLNQKEITLYKLLCYKELVQKSDKQIAQVLRTSDQTCRILVSVFLEEPKAKYYLPKSFAKSEYETIFQKYIDSEQTNPNVLGLIFNAQSTGECPISDKLRLNAKRAYNTFWNNSKENAVSVQYGIGIIFTKQDEIVKCCRNGLNTEISYDKDWLEENLDYPTILNNFIYVFGMFDYCFRSTLVAAKSHIGAIERSFLPHGTKYYVKGNRFNITSIRSSAQMNAYYHFLLDHGINIENIFTWFFETYLPEEFNVVGFTMKSSSANDYVEKCRNISSEMDGVLKQFRLYVDDGYIDRELFEIGSEQLRIDGLPSMINDKYAYPNSEEIKKEMHFLFSDQTTLGCTERTGTNYNTLFDLLQKEKCNKSDFAPYQITGLDWLIKRGSVIYNDDGTLQLNESRVAVLKDLYDHDVLCLQYLSNQSEVINEMKEKGDLKIENTLFSIPEKEYLNYVLNKAEYSNGLDLRNKYIHSTYPQDKAIQERDYIELLKTMVLIITKINEEFCWIKDHKEV